ncbi:histone chaperone [Baffinella frigidus]|nr:histone chaperone [Cryptophyta sp. CCMP2293]
MKESEFFEILSIKTLNNGCKINKDFEFEIFYQIKNVLEEDFQIKFIYVVSPLNEKSDQELESIKLPANKIGKFRVQLKFPPPDFSSISLEEIIGVTIILMIISHQKKEQLRIGYYVSNAFNKDFPNDTRFQRKNNLKYITRKIIINQPRITRFFD